MSASRINRVAVSGRGASSGRVSASGRVAASGRLNLFPYWLGSRLLAWYDAARITNGGSSGPTLGGMGTVTSAGTAPRTLTLTGTCTAAMNMSFVCTTAGIDSAARVKVSTDGGVTYPYTGVDPSAGGTISGITWSFTTGPYALDNTWTANTAIVTLPSRESSTGVHASGLDATMATAANQPTVTLADASYGSTSVLKFPIANSRLETGAAAFAQAVPYTVYLVGDSSVTTSLHYLFDYVAGGNRIYFANHTVSSVNKVFQGGPGGAGNDVVYDASSPTIYALTYQASPNYGSTYAAQSSTAGASGNIGSGNLTGLTIGNRQGGSQNANRISQLLVVSGLESQAQRLAMGTFLASYTGLTWS